MKFGILKKEILGIGLLAAIISLSSYSKAVTGKDIYEAAVSGRYLDLQQALDNGGDPNAIHESGLTALHFGAASKSEESGNICRLLVERGANINAVDKDNRTPVYMAAVRGLPETIEVLASMGADLNIKDRNEYSPLLRAVVEGNVGAAVTLLRFGAEWRCPKGPIASAFSVFHISAAKGYLEILKIMHEQGAEIDMTFTGSETYLKKSFASGEWDYLSYAGIDPDSTDSSEQEIVEKTLDGVDEQTALHAAAKEGHTEVVRWILENGAKINKPGIMGITPLTLAVASDNVDTIKCLLESGASVKQEPGILSPLHFAAEKGCLEIVNILVKAGAEINVVGLADTTPLVAAIAGGHKDVVIFLLENGADVNFRDSLGLLPIHHAAFEGNPTMIALLIKSGADVNALETRKGNPPLYFAVNSKSIDSVEVLIEAGADVNLKGVKGFTALHVAVKRGLKEIVRILLDSGANPNIQDEQDLTPMNYAEEKGYTELLELMQTKIGVSQ